MKNFFLIFLAIWLGFSSLGQTKNLEDYVGSKVCGKCHPKHYRGWRATLHPYKFQKASPQTVIGNFNQATLKAENQTFRMFQKNERFFVEISDAQGQKVYTVDYVIGEFWKQLYVTTFKNGELHILPVMWIVAQEKWTTTKYWPKAVYQYACAGCHNTGVVVRGDQVRWKEMGVGCEACHGPGAKHVKKAPNEQGAGDIINPARIPDAKLAAMVCGRCHLRGRSKDGRFAYPVNYEPGQYLAFDFQETPKLHPDDSSKANRQQYIDWKKSGHAKAGVMCWDCHETHHKGRANRYQTKLPGNKLCLGCHQINPIGVHGIHSVNNCIGCHMPPTGKRATKGDVHSHRFEVIYPQVGKETNSCNLCHYHRNDDPAELENLLKRIKSAGRARNFYR